jgi:hypothetical protein
LRFTVRRPASAEVSPCCHRPSGGDIACSVHVGVARPRVAGFALEHRLALAVSGSDVPAHRASLRRVRGRDLLDPTTSLMLQPRGEQTPSASANAPVKAALLCHSYAGLLNGTPRTASHSTHVKGFDANRIEAPRDVSGGLFDPVPPSVSLTRLQLRDRQLRVSSPVGAALGTGQPPLQHLQPDGLTTAQARGMQQLPGRQGRRHRNTPVDTYHAAFARTRDRLRDMGKRDVPAPSPITGDPVRLGPLGDWPRPAKAHPADLGHPHTAEPTVQALNMVRFHPDLPKPLVHTGFAPRGAAMRSGEKVAHRLGEVPQRLLLHGLGASGQPVVVATGSSQLSALLVVARRTAPALPELLLLDSQIPHIPGVATMLRQQCRLLSGRKQPIARHTCNLTATTDKSPKGAAAVPPAAVGDFHAATIR